MITSIWKCTFRLSFKIALGQNCLSESDSREKVEKDTKMGEYKKRGRCYRTKTVLNKNQGKSIVKKQ